MIQRPEAYVPGTFNAEDWQISNYGTYLSLQGTKRKCPCYLWFQMKISCWSHYTQWRFGQVTKTVTPLHDSDLTLLNKFNEQVATLTRCMVGSEDFEACLGGSL